jgi:hypothetical protein
MGKLIWGGFFNSIFIFCCAFNVISSSSQIFENKFHNKLLFFGKRDFSRKGSRQKIKKVKYLVKYKKSFKQLITKSEIISAVLRKIYFVWCKTLILLKGKYFIYCTLG